MTRLFGYIDPGTGSVLVQAVIGGVAGVLYAAKRQIKAVIGKFRHVGAPDRD